MNKNKVMSRMHKVDPEIIADCVRKNLISRREKSALTIDDVAEHSGVDAGELRRIEAGESVPAADVLYQLSDFWQCDVNDFYMGIIDFKLPSRNAGSENAETLLEKHLMRDFKNMASPEMRFAFAAMMHGTSLFTQFIEMQGFAMRKI